MRYFPALPFEFHVSRRARDRYNFDQTLFATDGNVIFADLGQVRRFAHAMNSVRDVARFPETAIRAGQLGAMGLVDELFHVIVARFREQKNPMLWRDALRHLE